MLIGFFQVCLKIAILQRRQIQAGVRVQNRQRRAPKVPQSKQLHRKRKNSCIILPVAQIATPRVAIATATVIAAIANKIISTTKAFAISAVALTKKANLFGNNI